MPHFGLMDPDALGPVEEALQRARLHIRGGRRRLRQGKISAGLVTLHDALSNAMQWYVLSNQLIDKLKIQYGEQVNNDRTLFHILVRSGHLKTGFDYDAFDRLVEQALHKDISALDDKDILRKLDEIMTQLGIMPFDESTLPPEDPKTF